MSYHVAQKLARSHTKSAFGSIKAQLVFPQNFKNVPEVSHMLRHHFTLHHHILYIDLNILAQLWFKHSNYHPLIGRPYVFQTKRHHFVVVISNRSDKSCP